MNTPDDREGMFTHPRMLNGKLIVTCRRCGAALTSADTDAHVCDPTRAEDPAWQDY